MDTETVHSISSVVTALGVVIVAFLNAGFGKKLSELQLAIERQISSVRSAVEVHVAKDEEIHDAIDSRVARLERTK